MIKVYHDSIKASINGGFVKSHTQGNRLPYRQERFKLETTFAVG